MSGDTRETVRDTPVPAVFRGVSVLARAARPSQSKRAMHPSSLDSVLAVTLVACSPASSSALIAPPPAIDVASPLRGIPDPGADPAVVLLDLGSDGQCTGALLASDVVLTARRCVAILSSDLPCPAPSAGAANTRDLTTVRVLVGDAMSTATERARGRAVLLPEGDPLCGADIALLLLDATIDDVAPLVAHATGAAVGDHVRSLSSGWGYKLVRDHVPVAATSATELQLTEAPCDGAPGGPAIDETSGEVVGVVSRGGPACDSSHGYDIATRVDAFLPLVDQALADGTISHQSHQAKQKKGTVDLGSSCSRGSDCSAGICVEFAGAQYCTQACASRDHCPTDYRCMGTQQGPTACVTD